MTTFIDTSALYAVLSVDDPHNDEAGTIWTDLITRDEVLVSTNYILVETLALIQNRLGIDAVRDFQGTIVPILKIEWIDEYQHQEAASTLLTINRKQLSPVDCVSFATMRRLGIQNAFAFDAHFKEQGFTLLP